MNELVKDKKPSEIIEIMIRSLDRLDNDDRFEISMSTFGQQDRENGVCYGCAATATLIGLYPEKGEKFLNCELSFENREDFINGERDKKARSELISDFEDAIDEFRGGDANPFLGLWMEKEDANDLCIEYFGLDEENSFDGMEYPEMANWRLMSNTWRADIPEIRKFQKWLVSRGM